MSTFKHIAIAGNIGSGKTTLSSLLGKHYQWDTHFEDVDNNPYLFDFYDDMQRWSFNLQIYFLHSRFKQIIEIKKNDRPVIQDRTIYEDAMIFAPNLNEMGLMSERDFQNYQSLFHTVTELITPPDLLIYLKASVPVLVSQIQKRGREYEDSIRLDYLKKLNDRYETWIQNYKEGRLLIIDVDNLDYANKPEDLGKVIEMIDGELFGLF